MAMVILIKLFRAPIAPKTIPEIAHGSRRSDRPLPARRTVINRRHLMMWSVGGPPAQLRPLLIDLDGGRRLADGIASSAPSRYLIESLA